ncbi:MAG: glycosyltransferase [Candidatus Hodarchaeales archaeon]|jgi:hypothetical protein
MNNNYNYVVFIQIHGEADKLARCLESLSKQTKLPSNVVIVDDGTPDDSVYNQYVTITSTTDLNNIMVEYCRAAAPKSPNLDTVGKAIFYAWTTNVLVDGVPLYDYISIIDVDSLPEESYYQKIIDEMNSDPDLTCASGVIHIGDMKEELISAKAIKRKDARGSGKVIKTDFLAAIPLHLFPEVAWDTWINVKAKLAGKKAVQIPDIILYSSRATTRLVRRNNFRDGRLTYHFGSNPLLLLYKVIFRGRDVWRGYRDAKKKKWRLPDPEVRRFFGWRYLFRFWK